MTKKIEVPGIKAPPEIVDDITRREFLVGVGLIMLAPACGSGGGGDEGASSGEMKSVEHALGTTEVPVDPRRVIALDPYVALPTALLIGAPVVATSQLPFEEPFPPYIDEADTEGIEDVGWLQPNIETVATLEPDLIVGYETFLEESYEELSQIAPTVATRIAFESEWKPIVRKVAAVLGREEEIEDDLSAYEERIAEFEEAAGGRLDDTEATLLNIRALDDIRVYTGDPASQIMDEAGIRRPANQQGDDVSLELTIETLSEADADVILYFVGSAGTNPEEAEAQAERIQSNPLWETLGAVRNGRAYRVNPEWWFNAGSVQAANLILDDLFEHLVDGG